MDVPIYVAIISAIASLVVAIVSAVIALRNQRNLENLKASLVQEGLEKNARRDYEYSAKKKLYESYEPLLFQLSELSDMAFSRIEGIAKNAKEGTRLDNQIWQQFDSHYFRTTIYNVFAPLAIFKLIQKKLTFADFRIEEGIFLQYSLIKTLFYSFADDFKIARMRDLPEDKVYFARWNNQHKVFDPTFERQGLQSNKIDVIANAFLLRTTKTYVCALLPSSKLVLNLTTDLMRKSRKPLHFSKVFTLIPNQFYGVFYWCTPVSIAC